MFDSSRDCKSQPCQTITLHRTLRNIHVLDGVFPSMAPQGKFQGDGVEASWVLPARYLKMTPKEQAATVRNSILRYLREKGPASSNVIAKGIEAPNPDTVKKTLEWLTTTQQVYSEQYPGSQPIYFPNGRLAHPVLQGQVRVGNREYLIRTYSDRLTGKNLTVTEYFVHNSGERIPRGGIRVDLVDLDELLGELQRISHQARETAVVDGGLVTTERRTT